MAEPTRGETFVIQGGGSPDFSTFLLGLASSALIHLGSVPHPETGKAEPNLVLARQSMDLLTLLRDKTRGNLTAEEEKLFANLIADLQLKFVAAAPL